MDDPGQKIEINMQSVTADATQQLAVQLADKCVELAISRAFSAGLEEQLKEAREAIAALRPPPATVTEENSSVNKPARKATS